MRDVAALAGFAKAVAFDRFRQNHRGLAFVLHRRFVCGINFSRVVAAAQQLADLVVGQMIHQLQQLRIFAEKMSARVAARLDGIFLVIAVHRFFHALEQQAAGVARKQVVPIGSPDHLDDVPAGAAKKRFEFLNDFAVAANGAVEALKVAVDDPNQVVEVFARGKRDRAECFRFIAFAITEKRPDLRLFAANDSAGLHVTIETRLVDRENRAESHRDCRELPEVRHEIRMRIGRKPASVGKFLPEMLEIDVRPAALRERRAHKRPASRDPENRQDRHGISPCVRGENG